MAWVRTYSFGLMAAREPDGKFNVRGIPDKTIRPQRLITDINRPEQVVMRDLLVGSQSQLVGPIDLYLFSLDYSQKVRDEFLKEHGLVDAGDEQIDDYLDEHDLEMPTPGRIDLPTVRAGVPVSIIGRFLDPALKQFFLSMIGPVFEQ